MLPPNLHFIFSVILLFNVFKTIRHIFDRILICPCKMNSMISEHLKCFKRPRLYIIICERFLTLHYSQKIFFDKIRSQFVAIRQMGGIYLVFLWNLFIILRDHTFLPDLSKCIFATKFYEVLNEGSFSHRKMEII